MVWLLKEYPFLADYVKFLGCAIYAHPSYIYCSGRNGCYGLVLTWLDMLTQSGTLGQQLVVYFKQHTITVRFSDGDFAMRLDLDMAIEIGNAMLDETFSLLGNDAHLLLFAQFGHEITHHQQGYINAVSIQGEYLAYKNQVELARGYSQQATNLTFLALDTASDQWDALYVNLDSSSYTDMNFFMMPFYLDSITILTN